MDSINFGLIGLFIIPCSLKERLNQSNKSHGAQLLDKCKNNDEAKIFPTKEEQEKIKKFQIVQSRAKFDANSDANVKVVCIPADSQRGVFLKIKSNG